MSNNDLVNNSPQAGGSSGLQTLGRISASDDAGKALLAQPKRMALVLYLLLAEPRGFRRRDELIALFWPELPADAARNALSQALHFVRKTLGSEAIQSRGTTDLAADPSVTGCDVLEFEAHLAAGRLREAVAIYQGPFLPGFYLRETPELEHWIEDRRATLARRCAEALERLAREARADGRLEAAVDWWRRLSGHDPLDGRWCAGLVRALAEAGRRDEALQVAERHAALVRSELGVEPQDIVTEAIAAARAPRLSPQPDPADSVAGSRAERQGSMTVVPSDGAPVMLAPAGRSRWRSWWVGMAATVFVAIGVTMALLPREKSGAAETDPRRVLVAPLQNRTGDPRLDALGELTADWVTDALVRSDVANVVDQVTALYVARDLGLGEPDATPDQLVALRESTRSGRMITGAIDGAGDSVTFFLKVTDLSESRVEGTLRVVVPVEQASTTGVREVAERLAGLLGVTLDPVLRSTGAGGMAPPRLGAYQRFLRGMDHWDRGENRDAFDAFVSASRVDSNFVLPVIWARYTAGAGVIAPHRDSIAAVATRLVQTRGENLTPLERQALLSVSSLADSSLDTQMNALRGAADLAPGSRYAHLAAQRLLLQLRLPEAIHYWETIDHGIGWARHDGTSRWGLAVALLLNGEYRRGIEVVEEAIRTLPDPSPGWFGLKARFLTRLGREAELDQLVSEAQLAAASEGRADPYQSVMEALLRELDCMGRPDRVLDVAARLDQWMARLDRTPARRPAMDSLGSAERVGDWRAAERAARLILAGDSIPAALRNVYLGRLGIALALQGRTDEAREVSSWLAQGTPDLPLSINGQRARIAAALGDGDSAVILIRAAVESPAAATLLSAGALGWTDGPEWRPIRSHPGYRSLVGSRCAP